MNNMMNRIQTKQEKDRKAKIKQLLIGLILIVIMVVSTAGFAMMDNDEKQSRKKYNGLDFVYQDGQWKTLIDENVFSFQYFPDEVLNISNNINKSLSDYVGKPLYFVNTNSDYYEIMQNLNVFILRAQEACISEDCEKDVPVKNCSQDNIIIFEYSNFTEVREVENCVFIVGDTLLASDSFLYKILKIN